MKPFHSLVFIFTFLFSINAAAQTSGPQFYRASVLRGNAITSVFGNWGVIAQPSDARPHGAWMDTSNGYLGDESIFIGVEFPIQDYTNDGVPDTVHSVITCPVQRPALQQDVNPQTGEPWTLMPESIAVNPLSQSVPLSNDTSSWPPSWKSAGGIPVWKGINVAGKIEGSLEAFFSMNDANDHRFDTPANNPYQKNFTGISGQGIRVNVRYMQFADVEVKNVLFKVYDITNSSSINYQKAVFGSLMGTYVGITGNNHSPQEYDDDYSILKKNEGIVITGDYDNNCSRNPAWVGNVGKFAVGFVDTTVNYGLGSFYYFAPSNGIPLGKDEQLWKIMDVGTYSTPNNVVNDTLPVSGADGDFVYGSYYFPLLSQQTKRIVTFIAYGYTNAEILQTVFKARMHWKSTIAGVFPELRNNDRTPKEFILMQNFPNPFNPSTAIRYALPSALHVKLSVHDLLGREVITLVDEEQPQGWNEISWNAGTSANGLYFYRLAAGNFSDTKRMILLK